MKRRVNQLIGLLLGSLLLAACSVPVPNTPAPLKPALGPFNQAAWQFWPAAVSPRGVYDVARGERFMWVGTSFGVVRLDPVTRAYTSFDQLGRVQRVFPLADNAVYAGTTHGVYYFDGQAWSRVTFTSTYPVEPTSITAFSLDTQGDLWMLDNVSRSSRVYHLTGHVPPGHPWSATLSDSQVTPAPPLFPHNKPDCANWSAAATFIHSYRTPDECLQYRRAYTLREQRGGYGLYAVEANDSLWLISQEQRLLHLSAGDTTLSTRPFFSYGSLAPDPQQGVWIAAYDKGLFYATDTKLQPVSLGLEKYTLFSPFNLTVDTQGTVWVTTRDGLQFLGPDSKTWQRSTASPHSERSVSREAIAASPQGGVWVTAGEQLWHYAGHTFTQAPSPEDDGYLVPSVIKVDQAGHVWVIGNHRGVLEFNPATNQWQRHLAEHDFAQLSLGTDGALLALSYSRQLFSRPAGGNAWNPIAHLDSASDFAVVADNQGGAWVGRRQTAEVWHYPAGSNQPGALPLLEKENFNLLVDHQDRLWVSTPHELIRYDGQTWQTISAPPIGLISDLVTAPDGRLWFVGWRGVAVYDPTQDNQP